VSEPRLQWILLLQSGAKGNGSTGRKRYQWPEDATRREPASQERASPVARRRDSAEWNHHAGRTSGKPWGRSKIIRHGSSPYVLSKPVVDINSPTYRARPTATFAEFANRWDATVLSSTNQAHKALLRANCGGGCCLNWAAARLRTWTRNGCRRLFLNVAATRRRPETSWQPFA